MKISNGSIKYDEKTECNTAVEKEYIKLSSPTKGASRVKGNVPTFT